MTNIQSFIDPDIKQLQGEAVKLSNLIIEKQVELETLKHDLHIFSVEYQEHIAPYHLQKLNLDNQIHKLFTKLFKKNPYLAECIVNQFDYTPSQIDDTMLEQTKNAYSHNHQEHEDHIHKEKLTDNQLQEIKSIWKQLLLIYHPDKHYGDINRHQKATEITQIINEYYYNKDLNALRELKNKNLWDDTYIMPDEKNKLYDYLNILTAKLNDRENEVIRIQNDSLYELYSQYHVATSLGKQEMFYKSIIESIKSDILLAQELIKSLGDEK